MDINFVSVAEEMNSEPPRTTSASGRTVLIHTTSGYKFECAYLTLSLCLTCHIFDISSNMMLVKSLVLLSSWGCPMATT